MTRSVYLLGENGEQFVGVSGEGVTETFLDTVKTLQLSLRHGLLVGGYYRSKQKHVITRSDDWICRSNTYAENTNILTPTTENRR